jgi:hypothetical protein
VFNMMYLDKVEFKELWRSRDIGGRVEKNYVSNPFTCG